MAWTQTDVDALKNAMKRGVLRVTLSDGRTVQFNGIADQLQLLAAMENDVDASSETGSRSTYAGFQSG